MNAKKRLSKWSPLLCMMVAIPALAQPTANLSWTPPDKRADGTTISADEISHYDVYQKSPSDADFEKITESSEHNAQISNLSDGQHCFKLRTVDTAGVQSKDSETICLTVNPQTTEPKEACFVTTQCNEKVRALLGL